MGGPGRPGSTAYQVRWEGVLEPVRHARHLLPVPAQAEAVLVDYLRERRLAAHQAGAS